MRLSVDKAIHNHLKAVIQRVLQAGVAIEDKNICSIAQGLLVLLGVEPDDSNKEADLMLNKILNMRIFKDGQGKMNLSLLDVQAELLVVSQFTLMADTRKGNRPSFVQAASAEKASMLYDYFCNEAASKLTKGVKKGVFAADMKVDLVNDGPVTIILEIPYK